MMQSLTNPVTTSNKKLRRPSPYLTVRIDWLAKAACLPGRTLHYALALLSQANPDSLVVTPTRWTLTRYGISDDLATKALTRLTEAGLIRCERKRGYRPRIVIPVIPQLIPEFK